jgi:hypothetical protein
MKYPIYLFIVILLSAKTIEKLASGIQVSLGIRLYVAHPQTKRKY